MVKILGRELAVWLALVAGVVQVSTSFGLHVSPHVQGVVTAVVVFVFAVAVAVQAHDGIIALVSGVATALFSALAAFGFNWPADKQAAVITALTMIVGFFVRTQVTSPVPASVSPAGKLVA